jgi:hypothetical protein
MHLDRMFLHAEIGTVHHVAIGHQHARRAMTQSFEGDPLFEDGAPFVVLGLGAARTRGGGQCDGQGVARGIQRA